MGDAAWCQRNGSGHEGGGPGRRCPSSWIKCQDLSAQAPRDASLSWLGVFRVLWASGRQSSKSPIDPTSTPLEGPARVLRCRAGDCWGNTWKGGRGPRASLASFPNFFVDRLPPSCLSIATTTKQTPSRHCRILFFFFLLRCDLFFLYAPNDTPYIIP